MPVKVTITKGRLTRIIKEVAKNYLSAAKKVLERKIPSTMSRGKSPVRGGRWDAPYSKDYLEKIKKDGLFRALGKRRSPVNLKLMGFLHNSFNVKRLRRKLRMDFGDHDDLADIHNRRGAGKAKAIRRMLPTNRGEEFNDDIDSALSKVLASSVRKAIKTK